MTLNRPLVYESPLNERIRLFLRLEQLFQQINHFLEGKNVWDSRAVSSRLLDILTIFTRNDIKSEILKELDRHSSVLSRIGENQGVDHNKLESILEELDSISRELYGTSGKVGIRLMENELFQTIAQHSSPPGGACAVDLPEYHFWPEQNEQTRHQDLLEWTAPFHPIRKAIYLILLFIRESSIPTMEVAESGFFSGRWITTRAVNYCGSRSTDQYPVLPRSAVENTGSKFDSCARPEMSAHRNPATTSNFFLPVAYSNDGTKIHPLIR